MRACETYLPAVDHVDGVNDETVHPNSSEFLGRLPTCHIIVTRFEDRVLSHVSQGIDDRGLVWISLQTVLRQLGQGYFPLMELEKILFVDRIAHIGWSVHF